jgi:hypothetical protein
MLETYSQNISVAQNVAIPFNNVSIEKGCTAEKTAPTTIALNKCGVYMVEFDAVVASSGTSGNVVVQMSKDDVLQPQAFTATTSTGATDVESISFLTLVQVAKNNSNCCCASPTILKFMNTGIAANFIQANATVTKIC